MCPPIRSARSIAAPPRQLVQQRFVFQKTNCENVRTVVRTNKSAESGDCHAHAHPTATMEGWIFWGMSIGRHVSNRRGGVQGEGELVIQPLDCRFGRELSRRDVQRLNHGLINDYNRGTR